jgi:hypothetical protein
VPTGKQSQSGWTIEVGASTLKDPAPEASESFAAMEAEIAQAERNDALADPVAPCETTWLELTLTDADGNPAANAKYRLTAPGGEGRTGTLDENGFARIDDIDVPADTAMLKVWIVDDPSDPDAPPRYEVQVVEKADEAEAEAEAEPEADDAAEPEYFHSTFDRQLEDDDER